MRVSRQFYFLNKKNESKSFGIGKLVKVSPYIPTFTNLLNPSEYADLPVPQINDEFLCQANKNKKGNFKCT